MSEKKQAKNCVYKIVCSFLKKEEEEGGREEERETERNKENKLASYACRANSIKIHKNLV